MEKPRQKRQPVTIKSDIGLELDGLHQIIADLDVMAKKNQEITEKMYYSPLPKVLFHATTKEKAEKIMQVGLQPSPLIYEDESVVSLSDTIGFAKFCAAETQQVELSELVVLEITTHGLDRDQAKSYLELPNPIDEGEPLHEVHYLGSINADWIYRLNPKETSEIELTE